MDWDSMVSREVANVLRRGGRTLRNLFSRISPEEGVRTRPTRMTKTKILNDGEVTSTDDDYTQYSSTSQKSRGVGVEKVEN